ncbi:MAG: hypothetical protein M1831_000530 [Alyxoria varia]|nr:MAG: hypothetical protein M1831_000530 [Alyxoria varia]
MSSSSPSKDDPHVGPYILTILLDQVPLAENGENEGLHITCADYWDSNLYVGTSAAEILHYALIPSDPTVASQQPTFILASRLRPDYEPTKKLNTQPDGIQQILVLPTAGKACVLCNSTLSFYSLPELSPAFGGAIKLPACSWVGGVDLDSAKDDSDGPEGIEVMICVEDRIRVVKIGEKPKTVRTMELGGCLNAVRRGNIACIANASGYSLLDVVERQRIPLFPISSIRKTSSTDNTASAESPTVESSHKLSADPTAIAEYDGDHGTGREGAQNLSQMDNPGRVPTPPAVNDISADRNGSERTEEVATSASVPYPTRSSSLSMSSSVNNSGDESNSKPARQVDTREPEEPKSTKERDPTSVENLGPHILSSAPTEFFLTTGTSKAEPGVGMFVDLDGEVVRGTVQFSHYPQSVVFDKPESNLATTWSKGEEGYLIAVMDRTHEQEVVLGLEIRRLEIEPSGNDGMFWLPLEEQQMSVQEQSTVPVLGIRSAQTKYESSIAEVVDKLRLMHNKLDIDGEQPRSNESDYPKAIAERERSEADFVSQLSRSKSRVLVWRRNTVFIAVQTPTLLRLDAALALAFQSYTTDGDGSLDRMAVEHTIDELYGFEPQNELEFLTSKYIRQKSSLLLYMDLVLATLSNLMTYEHHRQLARDTLQAGEIDPRIVLAVTPVLREEINQGDMGIWLHGGLKSCLDLFLGKAGFQVSVDPESRLAENVFPILKTYLMFWRRKKGFGSVADETEVFSSVDAALLRMLLILDSRFPKGPGKKGSIRSELGALVDANLDCFDRAVTLLKDFKRPYVLSRLYQSAKEYDKVLATWKSIVEGAPDEGGELENGEEKIRKYLTERKNRGLVEEYGTWLARRDPAIGVRVFADERAHVKHAPEQVVSILKERAPNAVKYFLEYLVFSRNLPQYANDLVTYYLDSVITELESSNDSREALLASYKAYRALKPPKPTYSQFAAENSIKTDWWANRLRLLQLLGGSHGAASQYDMPKILKRIEQFKEELVPESIILSGRQGHHHDAIRLLTHGLGDFDTAISYCVLGGASTYSPLSGGLQQEAKPSRDQQMKLFDQLLEEFMRIPQPSLRMSQTSGLLHRFASWFEISHVLSLIPDFWPVDILEGYLESTLRQLIAERNESIVVRALRSTENLSTNASLVEKLVALGPIFDSKCQQAENI